MVDLTEKDHATIAKLNRFNPNAVKAALAGMDTKMAGILAGQSGEGAVALPQRDTQADTLADLRELILLAHVTDRNLFLQVPSVNSDRRLDSKLPSPIDGDRTTFFSSNDDTTEIFFTVSAPAHDKRRVGRFVYFSQSSTIPVALRPHFAMGVQLSHPRAVVHSAIKRMKPIVSVEDLSTVQMAIVELYNDNIESLDARVTKIYKAFVPHSAEFHAVHGENAFQIVEYLTKDGLPDIASHDAAILACARAILAGRTEVLDDDLAMMFSQMWHQVAVNSRARKEGFDVIDYARRTANGAIALTDEAVAEACKRVVETHQITPVAVEGDHEHVHGPDCNHGHVHGPDCKHD